MASEEHDTPSDESAKQCGLYRTTSELAEHPGSIGPNMLVYYHNHSDQGPPIVLLPEQNTNNKWRFHRNGYSVTDPNYIASLQPLKPEGMYRFRDHFHPDEQRIVASNALVQLGYNTSAEPIVFFPTYRADDNALVFPSSGMRVPPKIYALLEQLDTRGPRQQQQRQLH